MRQLPVHSSTSAGQQPQPLPRTPPLLHTPLSAAPPVLPSLPPPPQPVPHAGRGVSLPPDPLAFLLPASLYGKSWASQHGGQPTEAWHQQQRQQQQSVAAAAGPSIRRPAVGQLANENLDQLAQQATGGHIAQRHGNPDLAVVPGNRQQTHALGSARQPKRA
ncbi:hypothetical protein WJX84_004090 [Apatococcus fuscideae]